MNVINFHDYVLSNDNAEELIKIYHGTKTFLSEATIERLIFEFTQGRLTFPDQFIDDLASDFAEILRNRKRLN